MSDAVPGRSDLTFSVFHPRDGAVLDLQSLEAIAELPSSLLSAALTARVPQATGLVLEGLELKGTASPGGPRLPERFVDGHVA